MLSPTFPFNIICQRLAVQRKPACDRESMFEKDALNAGFPAVSTSRVQLDQTPSIRTIVVDEC
jgi:hypothetical protein